LGSIAIAGPRITDGFAAGQIIKAFGGSSSSPIYVVYVETGVVKNFSHARVEVKIPLAEREGGGGNERRLAAQAAYERHFASILFEFYAFQGLSSKQSKLRCVPHCCGTRGRLFGVGVARLIFDWRPGRVLSTGMTGRV